MKFPISTAIEPLPYGPTNIGTILKVDGNAGGIPPTFQSAITTSDKTGNALCWQAVEPMTEKQWAGWMDAEDRQYILDCMAENLGVVRAKN